MSAHFLTDVNWQRPWLSHVSETGQALTSADDWRSELNASAAEKKLRNHRGLPLHFVPQANLPPHTAYEAFISATGGVPTRENLHDFFNALGWLTFPEIKIQLNAMQTAEIEKAGTRFPSGYGSGGTVRGKVRDAATIFDENAALLVIRDSALLNALCAHQWEEAFLSRRQAFGRDCEVWLFGHALMEKLVLPYKGITAHVFPIQADSDYFEWPVPQKLSWLDNVVAKQLEGGLTTSGFTPIPVLGVPGWWEGQDEDFYGDTAVFRPKRLR